MRRHRPSRHDRRARFERLESRQLLATFTVTSNADSGSGTFRDAIDQVDADTGTGLDTIDFAIGSGGLQTIAVKTELPGVTHPVLIDGSSQPGTSTTPRIELNGKGAGGANFGLEIGATGSTVRGLAIDGFANDGNEDGAGILLDAADPGGGPDDTVVGCFLGTNPAGTAASPDGVGIEVRSDHDTIGGTTAADRNLISGNLTANILVGGATIPFLFDTFDSANAAVIEGNLIGTDVTGGVALPGATAGSIGIDTYFSGTEGPSLLLAGGAFAPTIGGTAAGAGNVIAGNPGDGIKDLGITGLVAEGNKVGVGLGGQAVGNGGDGIDFLGFRPYYTPLTTLYFDYDATVGGTGTAQANAIANNAGAGVDIATDKDILANEPVAVGYVAGVAVRGDSIFGNAQGNIDFDGVPRSPNTAPGAGVGPNRLQGRPVITSAVASGGSVTIAGTLDSGSNTPFALDFFSSKPTTPVLAFGQAQAFLGSQSFTSDASGHVAFTATLPDAAYAAGDLFTATATDPLGDTSEVSDDDPNVQPANQYPVLTLHTSASPATARAGVPITFTTTVSNVGDAAATGVVVSDHEPLGFKSYSTSQGTSEVIDGILAADLGTIAAGQSATITVVVTPVAGAPVANYVNLLGTLTSANQVITEGQAPADYSGIGRTDLAVYLPSIGSFAIRPASGGPDQIVPFGFAGAGQTIPVSGDYFETGSTDIAAYLPSIGVFALRPPSGPDVIVPFGFAGAGQTIPVSGDFFGYGETDIAAYLPSVGSFVIRPPSGSDEIIPFGFAGAGQTIPAPGDYDGDGKTDIAAYLPSLGEFAIRPSSGGPDEIIPFGVAGSIPMPGDYDGSGKAELAVYMPSLGEFAYRPANGNPDVIEPFGFAGAGQTIPAPGDYDGDGRTDLAVYLPSVGAFAVRPSSGGSDQITYFGFAGAGGTVPVTASEPLASPAGVSAASVRAESVTVAPVASPAPASASRVAAAVGSAVPSGPASRRRALVAVAQGSEKVGPDL